MYDICYFFLIFFLYSILGYFIECFCCSIIEKRIVLNRGFCLGPYLPIFGFSAIVITFLFYPYRDMPLLLFFLSACSCTMIEYITSYLLELIFHARWWDYKDKKFNINGRVCLSNSILFGVAGLFCVHVFTPFFSFLLDLLSSTAFNYHWYHLYGSFPQPMSLLRLLHLFKLKLFPWAGKIKMQHKRYPLKYMIKFPKIEF